MEPVTNDSTFIRHIACPSCGSSDANSLYSDGHSFCFACDYHTPGDGSSEDYVQEAKPIEEALRPYFEAQVRPLTARGISQDTCQKYGYRVGKLGNSPVHFAPYYKDNALCAVKVRTKDKDFPVLGKNRKSQFFGQQLFSSGKMLVITEGEVDALTCSQIFGNKYASISVPTGAKGALKSFKENLDYFDNFECIVIFFDMDEEGQKAAKECAEILPPGKAKIVHIQGAKDANEMLTQGRTQELVAAIWNAKEFRPDGIVSGEELWDSLIQDDSKDSTPYHWNGLNFKTKGLRKGELVTLCAGSGIGKSSVVREIAYDLIKKGETVGMLMLEENTKRTAMGLMGLHLNKPIHIERGDVTDEQLREAFEATVGSGHVYLYDSWGSSDIDNLLSRIRYMARSLGCGWIVLDHLSIVVSANSEGDERRLIDNTMTALRKLVEETGVGMLLVSHLKRPEGKVGHEEGSVTSLSQLRGSHAIAQLSDICLGFERNQQSEEDANKMTVRVLKNRFTGETGVACSLMYDKESGRLTEGGDYGF